MESMSDFIGMIALLIIGGAAYMLIAKEIIWPKRKKKENEK